MKTKTPKSPAAKPKVALPTKAKTKILQAHVSTALFDAIKEEAKKQKRYVRDIVQWGLEEFLAHSAPQQAKKLGITFRN